MVILVRCPDRSVTVALQSRLAELISEGLITEYLGPRGWLAATEFRACVKSPTQPRKTCCNRQVSCL